MLGIVYCLLGVLLGREIAGSFLTERRGCKRPVTGLWLLLPGAFGMGMLVFGWVTYMVSWAASALGAGKPLFYGNLAVMSCAALLLVFIYYKRYRKTGSIRPSEAECRLVPDRRRFKKELFIFGGLLVFITVMMFYVFYIKDGILYSGYTVYGDYAPHTAMMRSFSMGNNFPTGYPHFGGQDVKYHFMFQFLTGNLEYLGLRLDYAYNLLSILALLGFLMLLYNLSARITGSFRAAAAALVLFFFRSGLTFFHYVWEHFRSGDLLEVLRDNTAFIGYTPNENWGLWNFNVYLNQRHLAFGLLIVALFLWMYLDWLDAGCSHGEKGVLWLKNRFFTKAAWKSRNPENALLAGMFLGLISFWNGAALIGGLLILAGFAVFSDGKLDYLLTAVTSVLFAVLQTKIFIWGSAVKTSFYWGFIAEDKSLAGVLWFILQMSGIFFLGMAVLFFFFKKRQQRAAMVSFFLPFAFAFCVSLTSDINVNHKYIMISYAFFCMFWGLALAKLFQKKIRFRVLAAVLAVCLTATGIYDFVIILRNNGPGRRVAVNLNSALTAWLSENLNHEDLLLTPEYSINEVTMSGVMMYMGWPYYAWSAGYDTYGRAEKARTIYSSYDAEEISATVQQEKITYILYEEGMEYESTSCHEETIAQLYPMVYQSEDGRIRIYETTEDN